MLQLVKTSLFDPQFRLVSFRRFERLYQLVFDSRWTILVLVALGVLRAGFMFLAYAPADGADAMDYYAYAAYMSGSDLPARVANISPMYPFFIYLNRYIFGQFELLFFWQFLMSASLGVLIYVGLRPYHAAWAVLVALVVIGDAQVGTLFNFTATEPLYVFLLLSLYSMVLVQNHAIAKKASRLRDVGIGILLVLVRETRTVARYLIVPVVVLYAVSTRNWRRVILILVTFVITQLAFDSMTKIADVEQVASDSDTMILGTLLREGIFVAHSGGNSSTLTWTLDTCFKKYEQQDLRICLEEELGSPEAVTELLNSVYYESMSRDKVGTLRRMFEELTAFLKLSGRQVYGTPTPADVQCEDIPARIDRQVEMAFNQFWRGLQISDSQASMYRDIVTDFAHKLCPPTYTNGTIHDITDYIALRYRSLSRPHPYVWNSVLVILVLGLPWARRLWLPVFLAGGILAYHASVSAYVFNVQPRYVVVTNPFKAVLVVTLLFLIGMMVLKVVDQMLVNRQTRR